MQNVALYGGIILKKNLCFDRNSIFNQDNRIEQLVRLKEYLHKKNINLNTLDMYKSFSEIDCIIQIDEVNRVSNKIPTILILLEVDSVRPENWRLSKINNFDYVFFIHDTDLLKEIAFKGETFTWPVYLSKINKSITKKFEFNYGLVSSNKFNYHKTSTFPFRRELIKFFEINKRNDFRHF